MDDWLGDAGLRVDWWLTGKCERMIIWGWDMQLVMELVGPNHLAVLRLNLLFGYFENAYKMYKQINFCGVIDDCIEAACNRKNK